MRNRGAPIISARSASTRSPPTDVARIGERIVEPAVALGKGLTEAAAKDLGLAPGTPVGASLIDAHAGAVGTIGASVDGANTEVNVLDRLAYIMGTSACIMASTGGAEFRARRPGVRIFPPCCRGAG